MDTADTKKEAETRGWELQREAEEEGDGILVGIGYKDEMSLRARE